MSNEAINSNERIDVDALYLATLEGLQDAGGSMQRRDLMAEVERRVVHLLTAYDRSRSRPDAPRSRWETKLTWESVAMATAGWITKTGGVWTLTDAGIQALASHPAGAGLAAEANRQYYKEHGGAQTGHYADKIDAALEFLEPGSWTTYTDLAVAAGTNAQTVGWYLGDRQPEGAHRVLNAQGKSVDGFRWPDLHRADTQEEVLEAEGVTFDQRDTADATQRVTAEDLREYLEEAGVVEAPSQSAWLVRGASVDGHDIVPLWRDQGFVSLRAANLRQVSPGLSRSELKEIVASDYPQASYAAKAAKVDEFHYFLTKMQPGDIVVSTSQGRLYVGLITGEATYRKSDGDLYNLTRAVDWDSRSFETGTLDPKLKARLAMQFDVVHLTAQLDQINSLIESSSGDEEEAAVRPVRELELPDASAELAEQLHVDEAWLQECVELLRDRPQLIFYGPPGTGKTFIAQALARHLAGDASRVKLVQFHPSYTYEDFFEGYRPNPEGGFELKPGPMRRAVDAAKENPHEAHFLIIDEINRGNLAKIFGELYFLLEYRDEQIDLLYATNDDVGFTLPDNVFIIGTMNTADRSIALVDAAMRRRFSFLPLHPDEKPTSDVLRRWLDKEGHDSIPAELLEELNSRIDDPDFKIGPSYLMRPAVYADGGIERVWRTAILPLLEEHHYGDGTDVETRYGLAALRAALEVDDAARDS